MTRIREILLIVMTAAIIFFGWMTIKELMAFNSAFYPKWNTQKAKDLLNRFGLDEKFKIKNLSRGMKLKLGLIVALAAVPELLILDDPTSGMDVPTRHDFLKGIIREILDEGTSILFSSHLVHELEGIIDHLGILHNGNLILEENFQQVKNDAKKVHLVFDGSVPEEIDIKGLLTKQTDGNKCDLGIYPWGEDVKKNLEALHPSNLNVESMTLGLDKIAMRMMLTRTFSTESPCGKHEIPEFTLRYGVMGKLHRMSVAMIEVDGKE